MSSGIFRTLLAQPRLLISALTGIATVLALSLNVLQPQMHLATRLIIGWNVSACLYLLLAGIMVAQSTQAKMQQRACEHDEGRSLILTFVVLASIACLAAIVVELAVVKDIKDPLVRIGHIALAVLTIITAWAFTHVMFALHYAHDFYVARSKGKPGGLSFPGDHPADNLEPEYGDFLYFAFVIGTSGQTADVSLTSKAMRRLGLVHCGLAFVFNTTVLALTINIAASLL